MFLPFLLLVVSTVLANPLEEKFPSLEGAYVFRLVAKTDEQLLAILAYDGKEGYDILKYANAPGADVMLMVTADHVETFEKFISEHDIDHKITTKNVQEAVDQEAARQRSAAATRADENGRISFTSFPRYDTVVEYLKQAATDRSDIVTLINFGTSEEGRSIYGLKISSGGTGKPAVLVEGTIHAREWIAASTLLYFLEELIYNASNSDLFDTVDHYIIPILNPDGYETSHTYYRFWRKTRKVNANSTCLGVDANRNFDHYWMTIGASSNPCYSSFAGDEPFSAAESRVLRDFVLANTDTIKLYLSYHSYGRYMLYPWGHIPDVPENEAELKALAEAADDAQATLRGTRYTIGPIANTLYSVSGASPDWMMSAAGIPLSFCVELEGGGLFGFDIPTSEIIPVAQETFLGFRVFSEYVAEKYEASK